MLFEPEKERNELGKEIQGEKTVSKKISPKRDQKPELKKLFDKIRAKKEAKDAAIKTDEKYVMDSPIDSSMKIKSESNDEPI